MFSKLEIPLLIVHVQLRLCIKIHTLKAFVCSYYSNSACFAGQLAAIIMCTNSRGNVRYDDIGLIYGQIKTNTEETLTE
jgi:hypothetical protein